MVPSRRDRHGSRTSCGPSCTSLRASSAPRLRRVSDVPPSGSPRTCASSGHPRKSRGRSAPTAGYWWPLGLLNAGGGVGSGWRPHRSALPLGCALLARAVFGLAVRLRRQSGMKPGGWAAVGSGGPCYLYSRHVQRGGAKPAIPTGAAGPWSWWPITTPSHSGLVFHLCSAAGCSPERFPELHDPLKANGPGAIMYCDVGLGPCDRGTRLSSCGRDGHVAWRVSLLAARSPPGSCSTSGRSAVVPGANDNLSGGRRAPWALARSLAHPDPVPRSAGAAVVDRLGGVVHGGHAGVHAPPSRTLDPATTTVLCLECVGSPTLTLVEAEGMLRMRHYSDAARQRLADAAQSVGVELVRGLRTIAATDASSLCAVATRPPRLHRSTRQVPGNYHWPSDTPENVDWGTVERAFAVADRFVRMGAVR